jgi:hypothetical protein
MICALEKGLRVQKFAKLHSPPKPTETPGTNSPITPDPGAAFKRSSHSGK